MGLSDIALNFVPLKEQDRSVTIYRKLVDDSSLPKADDDFRVSLPELASIGKLVLVAKSFFVPYLKTPSI